jgi:hypothetical protein
MRAAVAAAMDFRALLGYRDETLVKGLMLLTPGQRARLRLALEAADSPGMSLITDVEQAAEKVFQEVEGKVAEFDGAALAEARRLIADAKAAESALVTTLGNYRAEMAALVEKYGPEVVADVEAELAKLLAWVEGKFQTSA